MHLPHVQRTIPTSNTKRNPGIVSSKMSRRDRRFRYCPCQWSSPLILHLHHWSPPPFQSLAATRPCLGDSQIGWSIVQPFLCDLCPLAQRWSEVSLEFPGSPVQTLFRFDSRRVWWILTTVTSGIDIPCSIIPRQSSGTPRSQYKSRTVCLKEWLHVIEFDKIATPFLWASFKLHQYTVFCWDFPVFLYTAILDLSRSY